MTAFLIAIVDILDQERFAVYGSGLAGVTERAGGRYVLRGWCDEVLEGEFPAGSRVVVVAYDDPAGVERYSNDPAVIASKPLKPGAVHMNHSIVEHSSVAAPQTERSGTFLVIAATVNDAEAYGAYAAKSKSVALAHGGEYLVLGPIDRRIDGEPLAPGNHRAIVIQFPDAEAAGGYRNDPAYQRARKTLGDGAKLAVRLVAA
jgi:uncharacterized protein (DUF1330 family)